MPKWFVVFLAGMMCLSGLRAQVVAPPGVVKSAVDAVEDLGDRVVRGDHLAAVESMYPRWKERMAKRKGGLKKLEAELASIGPTMARNGVTILSVKSKGQPKTYEVWPGKTPATIGDARYTKWLLLVPTVTKFRIFQGEGTNSVVIDSHGFQVAISDKGSGTWSFINGSDVSVSDLRSLFISLPANMELPEVKRERAK